MAAQRGAQSDAGVGLDAARNAGKLHRLAHVPLAEQYIWTANDAAALRPDHAAYTFRERDRKTESHAFRGRFELKQLPAAATLYVASPRSTKAFVNGIPVMDSTADASSPLNSHVFRADVRSALRIGSNVLAIEAVRGRGIVAASDSPAVQQLAYGESLVAKIVPAESGVNGAPVVMTGPGWRSVSAPPQGWQVLGFDDRGWPRVQAMGPIESKAEFFQWNIDAGMYDWPGYMGMSSYLRTFSLAASVVSHRSDGAGGFSHTEALTDSSTRERFTVRLPAGTAAVDHAPGLLLDFGREVSGRVLIESGCVCEAQVLVSYGESESEALSGGHYLGTNLLRISPHGIMRGPKSGLRYAWLRFVGGRIQRIVRVFRSVAQPHLGDGGVHRSPVHAGWHLGRAEAGSRMVDRRSRCKRTGDRGHLCGSLSSE